MKKEHLEILAKIIGGVESGGQIYGGQNYAAYAGKAANSSNEKTCTLGWAQNYGNEGRRLCKMILAADAAAFRKADTAGIEKKLSVDWEATGWNPSAAEKKALVAIITTDAGKKCQDELFSELMNTYIKSSRSVWSDRHQSADDVVRDRTSRRTGTSEENLRQSIEAIHTGHDLHIPPARSAGHKQQQSGRGQEAPEQARVLRPLDKAVCHRRKGRFRKGRKENVFKTGSCRSG